jgi:PAS domain S-box-containing protein
MSEVPRTQLELRVLVLAPTAKDAAMSRTLLTEAGVEAAVFTSLPDMCRELERGAAALLLTEEALTADGLAGLVEVVGRQPAWSDLPVLVLTRGGAASERAGLALETLGNVTLLDRPVRVAMLVSAVRTAIRARQRQYQLREHLAEQERARDALRESERLYRAIGESIEYGVWVCEADGRNIYASESFLQLVGLTQEQCSEFGWGAVLHPDDAERTIAAWRECVRTGGTWDIEHRFRGVDGQWHPILARGVPVRDDNGAVVYWVGINLDISRQKRAEEALRDADRRKDEFLAMLAHELRNPLGAVVTAAAVLRHRGGSEPAIRRQQEVIDRQSRHMMRLLDDLLDVSRITQGRIELRRQLVDLGAVVEEVVPGSRSFMEARGHQFSVSLPPVSLWLDADPARLEQILSNLLTNAAKYTPDGGRIWLSVETEGQRDGETEGQRDREWESGPGTRGYPQGGSTGGGDIQPAALSPSLPHSVSPSLSHSVSPSYAVVRVRDTGAGISADLLPHIFDLFTQAERTLGRSEGGLGIGLTLVKRLVEMHSGTITAESEGPGLGSEFIVRLPIADCGSRIAEFPIPISQSAIRNPQSRRVLIVEDSRDAAETLVELVELWGHQAAVAASGEECLSVAQSFEPEIVLLDIGLPGMDGYEAARRLRSDLGLQGTYLVALTGYGQEEHRLSATDAGFDHHLIKPVDPDALRRLIADAAAL